MILEDLIRIAKTGLQRDTYLVPVFFLLKDETLIVPPTPISTLDEIFKKIYPGAQTNMEDSKSRDVFVIGRMAKEYGANRIIMIWDAAMKTIEKGQEYSPLEAPLTYPKSMRTECIIVNDIQLQSGTDNTVVVPYKGGDGEPVEFLPEILPKEGKIESRFTEIALKGYAYEESLEE